MEKATKKPRAKKAPPFIVPLEFTRTVLSGGKWAPRLALDIIEEIFGESVLAVAMALTQRGASSIDELREYLQRHRAESSFSGPVGSTPRIRAALMALMNYQLLRVTISRHMKKSKQANDAVVGAATNAMLAKNRKKTKQSVADATADQTFAESGAAEFTYSHVRYALDLHRVLLLVRWTHFLSIVRARFGYAGHALAAAALLDGPHDKESLCSSAQRMLLWEEDVEAEYPPLPPPGPSAPLYYRRMRAPYGPGAYLGVVLPFGSASLSRAGTAPSSPELLGASSSSAAAAAAANIPSIESLMMSHSSSLGGGGAASSSSSISLNLSSSDVMNVLAAAGGGGGACAPAVNFNFGDPEEMKAAFAAALLKERHARARVEAVWAAITDSGFLRVTRGLADDPTNTVPAEYLGGHRKATPEATAAAAAAEVAEAEALSSAIVAAASKKRKLPVAVIADDDDDAAPSSSFSAAAGARGLGSALGSSSGAAASVSALSSPPPTLYAFGYDTAACALRDEWVLRYIDGVTSPCSLAWWTDKGPSAIAGSEGARAAAAVAAAVAAEMGTGAPLKKTTAAATAAAAAAAAAVKKAAPKPSHPAVARAVLDDDDDDDNDDDDVVSAAAPRAKGTPLAAPSAAPPAPLPFLELKHFPSPLRTSLLCRVAAAMIRIHARASVFNVHEVQTLSVTAEQVRREIKKALKAAINESAVAAAEAAKTARASAAAVAAANYAAAAAATAAPSAAPSMTAAASARSSGTGGDPSGASSSASSSSSSSSSSSALSSTGWNRTVPSIEDVKAALVTLASCPARPVVDVTPEPEEDAAPAPPPDPIYSLHFRNVFREHARRALHCIIQERYGDKSARLMELLWFRSPMDEKSISEAAFINAKEARELLYTLMKDRLVDIQEVAKRPDHHTQFTFYLYRAEMPVTCTVVVDDLHHELLNLRVKRRMQQQKLRELDDTNAKVGGVADGGSAAAVTPIGGGAGASTLDDDDDDEDVEQHPSSSSSVVATSDVALQSAKLARQAVELARTEQGLARLVLAENNLDRTIFLLRDMHYRLWPRPESLGMIREE